MSKYRITAQLGSKWSTATNGWQLVSDDIEASDLHEALIKFGWLTSSKGYTKIKSVAAPVMLSEKEI
jgi:hypothetical protein